MMNADLKLPVKCCKRDTFGKLIDRLKNEVELKTVIGKLESIRTSSFSDRLHHMTPTFYFRRDVKYLNNLIEQDHRFIKRRVVASQHFREFNSATKTISGYEMMNALGKGQIKNVGRGDVLGQIKFIHSIFGIAV